MFVKIISLIMSAVMAAASFVYNSFDGVVDTVSEFIYGLPYTTQSIKYDFFNEIDDGDVVSLSEEKGFVKDKLAVFVSPDMKFSDKVNLMSTCGGIVSGWCMPADLFVISYPAMTYEQAVSRCEKLERLNGVELAVPVMASKTEPDVTPADNFDIANEPEFDWDELVPSGSNWWLEAIDARQAWDYSDYFSKINIGILDSGFETEHPELSGKIVFPDSKQARRNVPDNHGTHVAGIVSANHNGQGVAGICENANLICIDWMPDTLQLWSTDISIFFGFSTLVKSGAKVINLSLGTSGSKTSNSMGFFEAVFETAATSYMMASLLSKGYDFVVVQSAGNGDYLGDPVDARNNGRFCALNENNIFVGSKNVSASDILDRIFVVASATNNGDGTFTQSSFTNVGRSVTIAAPGEDIYSSSLDGGYEYLSGTSMSAPIVTGIASLVWSVNPSFTGPQIKEILCSSANRVAQVFTEWDYWYDVETLEYPMVNAKLAVEEAIRRTDSDVGTVSGKIVGDAAEISVDGISHTVFSDGTYSFVAPEGTYTAEIYSADGSIAGTTEIIVVAGHTLTIEDFIIETENESEGEM